MKKSSRPHSCNVLSLGPDGRRLWHFHTGGSRVSGGREHADTGNAPLPFKLVGKDWRNLFQPTLNIAWLPPESVFLRVAHLPAADAAELRAMLELQIEKLSPLPLGQMVWSFEALPKSAEGLQTAIVIFAERTAVEQFLGQLETQGYLPDRLEVPFVHELLAAPVEEDGVWIHPRLSGGRVHCLVAWWYGGVLRDLGLINIPNDSSAAATLQSHIGNMAWAGELDGWLTAPPRWHVVADNDTVAATSAMWQLDEQLQLVAPQAPKALAEMSATKNAAGRGEANLLPAEFSLRYRQRFVDRLWLRALGAAFAAYCIGVMAYFGWWQVIKYQADGAATEVRQLSGSYTNVVRLGERTRILQDQLALRFAALDAWRLVSEVMPEGIKLTSYGFSKGKGVSLFGEAPSEAFNDLAKFNAALSKASLTPGGPPFFSKVTPPQSQSRGATISWSFNLELAGAEIQ